MTDDRFEQRLRRAFGELRAAERRVTPPLERVLRRPPVALRGRAHAPLAWATAALTMLVAGAVWFAIRPPSPSHTERVLTDWQRLEVSSWGSPTRFLLDTPGRAVLTGVPRFNQAGGSMPVLREFPMMQFPSTSNPRRNDS
jgi:hypothetical protein